MNDFVALDLAGAGMRAQRQRMAVIAENLANQQTIGPNGPYQRKEVVFHATPLSAFDQSLQSAIDKAGGAENDSLHTVAVAEVRNDNSPPERTYEPGNPLADAQGYVSLPNISIFREMTDMVEASRSYEANLAAAKSTQDMLTAALQLAQR